MRLSIVRQYWSLVHVYLQKPARHFFGVDAVPPHSLSVVQFVVGRVSTTHAPWLQYLPAPHSASPVQDFTQPPPTHFEAAGSVHCASAVHPVGPPVAFGLHTPFSQVKPS